MSTTALVIEHLIVGLQAAIWLSLLVLTVFGWGWINLTVIKDFIPIITFLVIAVVYPIGIFVDELADFVFKPWMRRIRRERFRLECVPTDHSNLTAMDLLLKTNDEFVLTYFNYIRVRIRVSRSTAINLALITVTALIFIGFRFSHSQSFAPLILIVLFVGVLLTMLSVWVWREVSDTFARQIVRVLNKLSQENKN